MTLSELLTLEKQSRKSNKWLIVNENVTNDKGENVHVQLKSFGFYNQIFQIDHNPVNYCSGHTIDKVGKMHMFIKAKINNRI